MGPPWGICSALKYGRRPSCGIGPVYYSTGQTQSCRFLAQPPRGVLLRRVLVTVALILLPSTPLYGQHLRDKLSQLFIFGSGEQQLFLGGSGDPNNPEAIRLHGSHFIPSAVASNATVISFLTNS